MKPLKSLLLALPVFAAALASAEGPASGSKIDPAVPAALGITEEQVRDLCSYSQDVLSVGKQSYWSTYCEPAPKKKELADAQRFFKSDFDSYVFQAPNRKAQIEDLHKLLTGGEFSDVKDDSNRDKSQRVYLCLVKTDCLSGKKPEELADIDPPINSRSFPSWLTAAEANKMLPYLLIYENEKLRQAKYKELNVPVDEKERGKFCSAAANKASCARYESHQRQIETNKAVLDGMKGITDPAVLSRFMENATQRTGDAGMKEDGVLGQWRTSPDDPNMPLKPQQKFLTREAPAPAGAPAPPADNSAWGKTKAAAAAGLAAGAAMLAWRSSRKKGEAEALEEDKKAGAGEYTGPKTAEQAATQALPTKIVRADLTAPEQAVYDRAYSLWQNDGLGQGFEDFESWFTNQSGQRAMGQNSKTSTDEAYKSLLRKVNAINGRANR